MLLLIKALSWSPRNVEYKISGPLSFVGRSGVESYGFLPQDAMFLFQQAFPVQIAFEREL